MKHSYICTLHLLKNHIYSKIIASNRRFSPQTSSNERQYMKILRSKIQDNRDSLEIMADPI